MQSRIRYVKKDNVLQSFKAVEGLVVELHPETKLVFLLNSSDHSVVAKSEPVKGGMHKMKIKAKKMLEEKGIIFLAERRATNKGSSNE